METAKSFKSFLWFMFICFFELLTIYDRLSGFDEATHYQLDIKENADDSTKCPW